MDNDLLRMRRSRYKVLPDETIEVSLNPSEILVGAQIGIMRMTQNLKRGYKDYRGSRSDGTGWTKHIEGSMAEMAFAKFFDAYWSGNIGHHTDMPDVSVFEIRLRSEFWHDLPLHDHDTQDNQFIWLLSGNYGEYIIHGWTTIGAARKNAKAENFQKAHGKGRSADYLDKKYLRRPFEWFELYGEEFGHTKTI